MNKPILTERERFDEWYGAPADNKVAQTVYLRAWESWQAAILLTRIEDTMTNELEQMSPNQRRALDKALSALEAFASIWAAEIRLSELSARIAAVPGEAERAKRIAAMIEQGFIEGAYRYYLDHKDKCDELAILQAAKDKP